MVVCNLPPLSVSMGIMEVRCCKMTDPVLNEIKEILEGIAKDLDYLKKFLKDYSKEETVKAKTETENFALEGVL